MKPKMPETIEEAARLKAGAEIKRTLAPKLGTWDPTGARWNRREAEWMDEAADAYLDPASHSRDPVQVGCGGELVPLGKDAKESPGLVETVKDDPSYVNARASYERMELAAQAEALTLGLDAAETVQASNSLEKMLVHQMSSAHSLAMKCAAKAQHYLGNSSGWQIEQSLRDTARSQEAVRMANAAARLMDAYQKGMLTLERMRNGGKQVVTVQHVQVESGGQAVVTGQLNSRRGSQGRGRKLK